MIKINEEQLKIDARNMFKKILNITGKHTIDNLPRIYFVPMAAFKLRDIFKEEWKFKEVTTPEAADIIVDDIIDSGDTLVKHLQYDKLFFALYNKQSQFKKYAFKTLDTSEWVQIFPDDDGIESNITRILQYIGEDVTREGLVDTPKRVAKSFEKLYGGYKMNPETILKTTFTENHDEMIMLKDCEFYSTCEHHMLPFEGKIHIAYIPSDKGEVVGISKLARLVECYARRLQIQERLVNQIADAIVKYLKPKGVMIVAEAQHMCMTSRGVEKQNSIMITSSIKGVFKENQNQARQEFLNLIRR